MSDTPAPSRPDNVRSAIERGTMQLHGAYFGVAEGSLFALDQTTKEFRSVREMLQSGE